MSKESQSTNLHYAQPGENSALCTSKAQHSPRGNVIKLNTRQNNLKVVDYRSILEEIEFDKKNEVTVDLNNVVSKILFEENDAIRNFAGEHNKGDNHKRGALAEAFKEGFEAGKTEAAKFLKSEYEKKVQDNLMEFSSVVRAFSKEVERYDHEFDSAVVKLALAVAKRIVSHEIEIDEGAVLVRSREAIRKIVGVEKI
ncbi:MAG: FliH/SctL family protein, partial [Candidatus Kryptoniota bacterium]